ncbi:LPS export ABC transporter permease LptG [Motilimonas cestriensis]|uniref:LPS export ABC transporter permease LptG n=1 Tax=Motilimonas cestriensis TaxID=2742685 RepID=A0ABS8WB79_9GAMM|nr:LPS export ABC transporter permease LptG [Motilimonas cestriensis]MCE2596281.1 LPS export ABC transporter permease LptG [Motilimonas cestriensis]
MGILDRYIGRTIIAATLLCLLTLVGLSAIIKFVEQLGKVGEGDYDVMLAGLYVLLKMPKEIELFFPMAALLGSLVGLGSLASSSELVVMQAAGISKMRIALSVLKTAVPIMVLVMVIGEFVSPVSETAAKELRRGATYGGNVISSQYGVWAKDGDNFVSIGEVRNKTQVFDVKVFVFNDELKLSQSIHAERAEFTDKGWHAFNIQKTFFNDESVTSTSIDQEVWQSSLTPDKLSVVTIKPEDMSMRNLWAYIDYLKTNKQDASRYELALWRAVMVPFTVLVTMLLAISFIFGPLRTVTMGARLMMGIVVGFTFYVSNEMFGPVSLVFNIPPFIGALAPSLGFILLSAFLLKRQS